MLDSGISKSPFLILIDKIFCTSIFSVSLTEVVVLDRNGGLDRYMIVKIHPLSGISKDSLIGMVASIMPETSISKASSNLTLACSGFYRSISTA